MDMVTKKSRTVIFITFMVLFVLAAPAVILYSEGYRVDFVSKKVTQTGAFYLKGAPRAEVYLNGEFQDNTSLLGNSILIKNLLPRSYEVELKKDGYHSWKKTLAVKKKEVTKAGGVILFPLKPNFTIINQKFPQTVNSATSSDKKMTVGKKEHEIWVYSVKDQEKIFLTRFSEDIGDIFWLTNNYLIFNVGNKIKIAETDDRDKLNIIDLAEFADPKISWNQNSRKLYVSSGGKVYLIENLLP